MANTTRCCIVEVPITYTRVISEDYSEEADSVKEALLQLKARIDEEVAGEQRLLPEDEFVAVDWQNARLLEVAAWVPAEDLSEELRQAREDPELRWFGQGSWAFDDAELIGEETD